MSNDEPAARSAVQFYAMDELSAGLRFMKGCSCAIVSLHSRGVKLEKCSGSDFLMFF